MNIMDGQISMFDLISTDEDIIYPEWHDYTRASDNRKVAAYKCNDKDWYVIKSKEHDHYWMEHQKAFETSYKID